MTAWRRKLPWALAFPPLFFAVYGTTSYLSSLSDHHYHWYFSWELSIPFLPAASLAYLSLNLMGALALILVPGEAQMRTLFRVLMLETLIAAFFFIVFPASSAYPERVAVGVFAGWFEFADWLNLTGNKLPSLHVAFAFTFAYFYGAERGFWLRSLFYLWALAVAVSTLLLHEHHLAHILAGGALCWATLAVTHPRTRQTLPSAG